VLPYPEVFHCCQLGSQPADGCITEVNGTAANVAASQLVDILDNLSSFMIPETAETATIH
jgi:hypothetical protein